jgi:hypothetical protein
MSYETFETYTFQAKTLDLIERANLVIGEFRSRGFTLTLRQLYYQLVARSLLENTPAEYKRLGAVIKNVRRAGLIDWAAIEDRTRNVRTSASWSDPADIVAAAAQQYREDLWALQHYRPEVWIEKDALIGVIEAVCDEFRIPHFACRGNNSESEQYGAGKRFGSYCRRPHADRPASRRPRSQWFGHDARQPRPAGALRATPGRSATPRAEHGSSSTIPSAAELREGNRFQI